MNVTFYFGLCYKKYDDSSDCQAEHSSQCEVCVSKAKQHFVSLSEVEGS
ncbi:MAG: hypothetical protein Q4C98_06245 [Capnocytophaga sp.]|nr:hypothetical protein [Capnocytophaga sp.]